MTEPQFFDHDVWSIKDRVLHLDIPELLKKVGVEDTEENRDLAVKLARELVTKNWPGLPIEILRDGR